MKADLLIKNGRVIDPGRNLDGRGNVWIRHGRIISQNAVPGLTAARELDAEGCLVVPGLIDFHGHVNYMAAEIATHPDLTEIPTGVTAVADCGCTGVSNCRAYLDRLRQYMVKSRIFINVSPLGQSASQFTERMEPDCWSDEQFERAFDYGGERVIGLKVRVSRKIVGELGLRPLEAGIRVAERYKKKMLVHPTDPPVPQREILSMLRRGDVFCHTYMNHGHTILEGGKVCDAAWEAKKRGVWFDLAHGNTNFSWEVSEQAFREGFYPDLIGTDTTSKTWNYAPVYNLPSVMSKALSLRMTLQDVIRCVTYNSAKAMNWEEEIGTLAPGTCGDVTILKIREGNYRLPDSHGIYRSLGRLFVTQAVILDGMIVYRNQEFLDRECMG